MTSIILWFFLIAWIIVLIIPLTNKILTNETIQIINSMLDNLEYFIGSENLNIFLCMITIIIIIGLIRFFTKFYHINND